MEEINLIEVFNIFLRKWWLIVTLMIIGATAAYMYTDLFIQPTYETDGSFYVNVETQQVHNDEAVSSGKLNANQRLAITYTELLKSRTFLEEVSEQLGKDLKSVYTVQRIKSMLNVQAVNETEIIGLKVTGNDPDDIYQILNCIMANAPDKIINTVGGGSVTMVDIPYVPDHPVGPNKTKNTLVGAIIGFVISALMVFLMELFDTHIKSAEEMRTRYSEPMLGEIPQLNTEN